MRQEIFFILEAIRRFFLTDHFFMTEFLYASENIRTEQTRNKIKKCMVKKYEQFCKKEHLAQPLLDFDIDPPS